MYVQKAIEQEKNNSLWMFELCHVRRMTSCLTRDSRPCGTGHNAESADGLRSKAIDLAINLVEEAVSSGRENAERSSEAATCIV